MGSMQASRIHVRDAEMNTTWMPSHNDNGGEPFEWTIPRHHVPMRFTQRE